VDICLFTFSEACTNAEDSATICEPDERFQYLSFPRSSRWAYPPPLRGRFRYIATMTDDPDKYRSDMRKKLLELANSMPLAPMAAARDKKVRGLARETVENLLINQRPN
jgi:hypothetical protein